MHHAQDALAAATELAARGEHAQAEALVTRLLAHNQNNHAALHLMGVIARSTGRVNFSIELLRSAVRLDSSQARYHFDLGLSLNRGGNVEQGLAHFRRAAELKPDYHDAVLNAGTALDRLGRSEEARDWFERATALDPSCAIARYNLGNTHQAAGRLGEAKSCFAESIRLSPDFAKAHWNKGICHLLEGEFAEGWEGFGWRERAGEVVLDRYPQPRWQGQSLAGKTILLHAEQGIGDEILFASCLVDVISQARRCIVACDPRLQPILARSFPQAAVFGYPRRKDRAPFAPAERVDYQAPLGDLACHFRKDRSSFPHRTGYLLPDLTEVAAWRRRVDDLGPGLAVGISWRAGGHAHERAKRSTTLEQWLPLVAQPGAHFVSLQYGESGAELRELKEKHGVMVHDWTDGDPLIDLDSFAAKVAALDLVISVGNSTVHLAGSMGVPAWVVLPAVPNWRWLIEGETNPWYCSVRAIRQQTQGDWSTVFDEVARRLRERIGGAPSPTNIAAKNVRSIACQSPLIAFDAAAQLDQAKQAIRARDLDRGESLLLDILAHAPRNSAALFQLGLLARNTGRLDLALRMLARAADAEDSNPKIFNFLGATHVDLGQFEPAARAFRRAIELSPNYTAARNNLGCALERLGRTGEALACFSRAASEWPDHPDALSNLAKLQSRQTDHLAAQPKLATAATTMADRWRLPPPFEARLQAAAELFNAGQFEEAATIVSPIADQVKDHPVLLRILGIAARRAKQYDQAILQLKRATEIEPDSCPLHFELGVAYIESHQQQRAFECFLRCQQVRPDFQPAYINLAGILEQQERYDEALEWARKAVQLKPDCHMANYNLANCYRECGKIEQAISHYEQSLRAEPGYARAEWNLGICHLHLGNYEQGWPRYEFREVAEDVKIDRYTQPRWQGEPLAGKTIVVHAEQGLGDEVVFSSCIPDLLPLARHVIIVCDPRLEKLFRRSFPQATVYAWARKKDWSPFPITEHVDYQIPMGSLPLHLRRGRQHFSHRERFLTADAKLVAEWRERFDAIGAGLKIGISWRAGGKPLERRKRSTPLELWAPLFAVRNAHFVNLQYGDAIDDAAAVRDQFGVALHDWEQGDPLVDVDSFAAKIAALDLVISVGNATVHLAGGVGTPAWTLLPMIPSWRWMVRGDKSPWYSSVRVFRQPSRNDWAPVFDRLGQMLGELAAVRPEQRRDRAMAVDVPLAVENGSGHGSRRSEERDWLDFSQYSAAATVETLPATIKQAEEAAERGDFEAAESLFRSVLTIAPRHATALHGLGKVARRLGKTDLAIRSIKRALATPELVHVRRCDLAAALADAERFDEAAESYLRAIELAPDYYTAHYQFGLMLQGRERHSEAMARFRHAASLARDKAEPLAALAASQRALGQFEGAVKSLQTAIECEPSSSAAYLALAKLYLEDQAHTAAENCLKQAVALGGGSIEPSCLLAELYEAADKQDEAIATYQRVLELEPNHYQTLVRLGTLRAQLGQAEQAESSYRSAIELVITPSRELVNSLGTTLADQGRLEESLEYFDWALQLSGKEPYANAHVNRAFTLLQNGRYTEGWREYEWRWHCADAGRPRDHFRVPRWDGSSLAGKSILVHGEQGIGDEIMFATCYADVIGQAGRVVLTCEPRLEKLFRRAFPVATVISVVRGHEHQWQIPARLRVDCHVPAGSLPLHFRTSVESFPVQQQLLRADQVLVDRWRERFSALGDGLKIGVSWRAGDKPKDLRTRATRLDQWREVLRVPGVHFISLQHGDCGEELASVKRDLGIELNTWPDADNRNDLDGLAARIAALDLVISVGNANIHLAGALGVPSWSLLPCHGGWRWRRNSETTAWYRSVSLFRQPRQGDWRALFEEVRQRLLDLTCRHADDLTMRRIPGPHWSIAAVRQRISPGNAIG